jgi:hypothetical protein
MADNAELNAGAGGVTLAGASLSISGDTAFVQMCGNGILSGSEDSWTYSQIVGGAGAVGAGVQRMTLASDDPAVALLTTIDADTGAIKTAVEGTLTVGTHAVTQSGAWNITNVSGTVSLPTGAATAANQSTANTALAAIQAAVEGTLTVGSHAVTNAGTFAVQVDGAALTALQLIDDAVYADDADWTDGVSKHLLVGGLYQSSPQTISDGDVGPLQVTSNGYLLVSVNGTLTVASHDVTNAGTFAVQAAQSGAWNITNISGTVSLPTGAATESTLSTLDGKVTACDTGSIAGTVTANAGTNLNTSALALESGGNLATLAGAVSGSQMQVDVVAALPAGTNNIGAVFDRPDTSGGLSMSKTISAASTNATNVKNSAGQVYAVQVFNTNAAARYLKLYDKATAPTVGTDTPVKTLTIPGNTAGAGLVLNWDKGLVFSSGIGFGLTTGIADNDTGAVAANEIAVNLDYK